MQFAFEQLAVATKRLAAFAECDVGEPQIVLLVAVFGEIGADAPGGPGHQHAAA